MSQPNPPKKRKSSIKASVQPKGKVKIDAQAIAEAKAKDLAAHQHSQAFAHNPNPCHPSRRWQTLPTPHRSPL